MVPKFEELARNFTVCLLLKRNFSLLLFFIFIFFYPFEFLHPPKKTNKPSSAFPKTFNFKSHHPEWQMSCKRPEKPNFWVVSKKNLRLKVRLGNLRRAHMLSEHIRLWQPRQCFKTQMEKLLTAQATYLRAHLMWGSLLVNVQRFSSGFTSQKMNLMLLTQLISHCWPKWDERKWSVQNGFCSSETTKECSLIDSREVCKYW